METNGTKKGVNPITKLFRKVSQKIGKVVGSSWTFMGACLFVFVWFISGPLFDYSNKLI